jgi:hypothetical protein
VLLIKIVHIAMGMVIIGIYAINTVGGELLKLSPIESMIIKGLQRKSQGIWIKAATLFLFRNLKGQGVEFNSTERECDRP